MTNDLKIEKSELPFNSFLKADSSYEFIDGYSTDFLDKKDEINIKTIAKLFFTSEPNWVKSLMTIRDNAVGKLGLKTTGTTSDKAQDLENFNAEIGQNVGLFKVFHQSENEVVLGEDDKHLNFRVSLFMEPTQSEKKKLTISTSVKFNNLLGRAYFISVKPIHKLIVPSMLGRMVNQVQSL